jgi:16S rRNA (uracil1498-N3)-methyltransferase
MPHNRFFIDNKLAKDQIVELDGDEFFHLKKVYRKKEEDQIELINGNSILAVGTIISIEKRSARIKIDTLKTVKKKEVCLNLFQAITSPSNLSTIVEKACELNVDNFYIFASQNSQKKEISENAIKRLEKIVISSVKQSGRLDLPKIILIKDLFSLKISKDNNFFGDVDKKAPFLKFDDFENLKNSKISVFIGPEKGFTQKELDFLKNDLKAKGIKLSNNILRAETASIAAVTLFRYFLGSN